MATLATGGRPTRAPEQLRADIARARQEIASAAEALSREVSAAADWREWVRRRPGLALGLAFGLGLWLGMQDERVERGP
jgi:hypothetical protein